MEENFISQNTRRWLLGRVSSIMMCLACASHEIVDNVAEQLLQ